MILPSVVPFTQDKKFKCLFATLLLEQQL